MGPSCSSPTSSPSGGDYHSTGTTTVPAVITFSGDWEPGDIIDMDYKADSQPLGHATHPIATATTAAQAAQEFATLLLGGTDFTAAAVGDTVEFLAHLGGTTIDVSNLVVTKL